MKKREMDIHGIGSKVQNCGISWWDGIFVGTW